MEEELRLLPGAQLTSSGQTGGNTSLFVRGGPSNTTKVLIDGVSVNDALATAVETYDAAMKRVAK